MSIASKSITVYVGDALAAYGFGEGHPFGPDRLHAFWERMQALGLDSRVDIREPVQATETQILRFQDKDYLERVKAQSLSGSGYLDAGDTPAFKGVFEAASTGGGTVLAARAAGFSGPCRPACVPRAG
ncbi:MAG: acetoin utilization protein AcuC, partial [Thiogranum sp.]